MRTLSLLSATLVALVTGCASAGMAPAETRSGVLTDPAGMMLYQPEFTRPGLLAAYALGFPLNVLQGAATAVFLYFFAPPLTRKLEQLQSKYGLLEE